MRRKQALENDQIYHVMNKSIAGYKIFNTEADYRRMMRLIEYFSIAGSLPKFSYFLKRSEEVSQTFETYLDQCFPNPSRVVDIVAYCLMPTHVHFVLRQRKQSGIATFMSNVLNSYARYFNLRHKRKGPLWVGKFKNVMTESDDQLWHLSRYVHLNPTTAHLVDRAEDWSFSSYLEYITPSSVKRPLCSYDDLLETTPRAYRAFVEDQADYQREPAIIKHLILE